MVGENYLKSAYSYLYIGDYDSALAAFERCVQADPENPQYWFVGSVTLLRSDRAKEAVVWAHRATLIAPTDPLYRDHFQRSVAAWLLHVAMVAESSDCPARARRLQTIAAARYPCDDWTARQQRSADESDTECDTNSGRAAQAVK